MQLIKVYSQLHSEVQQLLFKVNQARYQTLTFTDALLYNDLGERKQKVIVLTEEFFIVSVWLLLSVDLGSTQHLSGR
jgi:hypothetical protein